MDSKLTQQPDYDIAASDRILNFESASIQTVAAFAEFLRYSRREEERRDSEGPRLRATSQPVVLQPHQRTRRPASSAYAELPESFQAELGHSHSPSTRGRTGTREHSPLSPRPSPSRPRSYSTTESEFPRFHPDTFREVLSNVRAMSGADRPDPDSNHARVARRLKELANEFERDHLRQYSRWEGVFAAVFGFPKPDLVQTFMRFVKQAREEDFSWPFLIRCFFFGFKLLQSLSPTIHFACLDEQQAELLDVFMNFLMDKMTVWIQSQGGWARFPEAVVCHSEVRPTTLAMISSSSSSVPESTLSLSVGGASAASTNATHTCSVPSSSVAPQPTTSQHLHETGTGTSTASTSIITTLPLGVLPDSLSTDLSSAGHGQSASAGPQSSSGGTSPMGSTRLAASFGLALSSFLQNRQ